MPPAESDSDYFKRRHEERDAARGGQALAEGRRQRWWQDQQEGLAHRYEPDLTRMLSAFAEEALGAGRHWVSGPEDSGHHLTWRLDYTRGEGSPERTLLVELHYLTGLEEGGGFIPDHFSVQGLTGVGIIKPPTIEALRAALGNDELRY